MHENLTRLKPWTEYSFGSNFRRWAAFFPFPTLPEQRKKVQNRSKRMNNSAQQSPSSSKLPNSQFPSQLHRKECQTSSGEIKNFYVCCSEQIERKNCRFSLKKSRKFINQLYFFQFEKDYKVSRSLMSAWDQASSTKSHEAGSKWFTVMWKIYSRHSRREDWSRR